VRHDSFDSSSVTTIEQTASVVAAMRVGGQRDGSPATWPPTSRLPPSLSKVHD
jgi:hypothetical protein